MSGLTESDETVGKKPAEETGGKISSRLVPDTFRRLAETTGLRREQSGKGGKGFLETPKSSPTTASIKDDELKEVIVDGEEGKKGKSAVGGAVGKKTKSAVDAKDGKRGKGEAGEDHSNDDDPTQDHITGDLDNGTDRPKKRADGGDQPKGKLGHRSLEKKPHTNEHQGNGEPSDRPHRRRRQREKGDAEEEPNPEKERPTASPTQDDQPSSAKHGADSGHTQQRAVIIDEHDESDSYDDDHICKKLQPLLRYVEYEYVINTSTGFANVFALLMSLLSKLGAFG
jgi:hypothetical protein